MGLFKASASVSAALDAEFAQALQGVVGNVEETLHEAAKAVAAEARRTSAFRDKTGRLRGKIKVEKSKFTGGGYIVTARSPHASLVERGHLLVLKSKKGIVKVVGHVTPKPFLRPALDLVRARLIANLKAMTTGAANG